jgi:hypothetical protein
MYIIFIQRGKSLVEVADLSTECAGGSDSWTIFGTLHLRMHTCPCATPGLENGKIVIIRQKPYRPSLEQTQRDHDRCQERRRNHGSVFDQMARTLPKVFGENPTKSKLMEFAQSIAAEKGLTIDRGAKRMKDGLICWFCENAPHLLVENTFESSNASPIPDHFDRGFTTEEFEPETGLKEEEYSWNVQFDDDF